jgi:hypothetical protein
MKYQFFLAVGLAFLVLFSALGYGAYFGFLAIHNTGNLYAVGIFAYQDNACTLNLTALDWGTMYIGSNVSRLVFLRNEGNTNVLLSFTFGNFTPVEASTVFALSWDYNGQPLSSHAVLPVTFTLMSTYTLGINFTNFSFDITVEGAG